MPPINWLLHQRAYAKINLGLYVLEKLSNGYHCIETGLVFINWYDEIYIYRHTKNQLYVDGNATLNQEKNNLVVQARDLFNQHIENPKPLKIILVKNIPVAAGLGGGSSNAACILRMLNQIYEFPLDEQMLLKLSFQLGTDVAFFLRNKSAIGHHLGEQLDYIPLIQPSCWILTIVPDIAISTKEIYQRIELIQCNRRKGQLKKILIEEPIKNWSSILKNELEHTVFLYFPTLFKIKEFLYKEGACYASMSGSGSSIFGLFYTSNQAKRVELMVNLKIKCSTKITYPHFIPKQ